MIKCQGGSFGWHVNGLGAHGASPDPDGMESASACARSGDLYKNGANNMYTILLIILVLLLIGALPTWPYSNGWGYYPSGGLGLILLIIIVLIVVKRV